MLTEEHPILGHLRPVNPKESTGIPPIFETFGPAKYYQKAEDNQLLVVYPDCMLEQRPLAFIRQEAGKYCLVDNASLCLHDSQVIDTKCPFQAALVLRNFDDQSLIAIVPSLINSGAVQIPLQNNNNNNLNFVPQNRFQKFLLAYHSFANWNFSAAMNHLIPETPSEPLIDDEKSILKEIIHNRSIKHPAHLWPGATKHDSYDYLSYAEEYWNHSENCPVECKSTCCTRKSCKWISSNG